MNDLKTFRSHFPLFKKHPEVVYLDNASTSQRVDCALEAEQHYYLDLNANVHRGLYPLSERATALYEGARDTVMDFINAPSLKTIIFTKSTTESLNMVAQGWAQARLKKGDKIVLSALEHHSNIVPWHLVAKRTGAEVEFCPLTPDGLLDEDALEKMLTPNTKIVSLTGLSNVLGSVVDIHKVTKMAHKIGAKLCIDAAQYAAHLPIDIQKMDVDFLAFSSHKLYGPTGAGVFYAKEEYLEEMDPWLGGGGMIQEVHQDHSTWNELPWKFEGGTPNIAQVIGLGAALKFIQGVGWEAIENHDRALQDYALEKLSTLPYIKALGPKTFEHHRACISFLMQEVHPHDVATILGDENICVRAGHHCAMPLMKLLNLVSTTRISFGLYNTKEDIDALFAGLEHVAKVFKLVS